MVYYPPDIHLSQVIVAYCQRVALATGSSLFVIDRAVNSVAMAGAFDDQGLGLLCMLDDNEHDGLESFEATEVDTLAGVYGGFMFEDPSTQQSQEVIDVALYYPPNFILLIHIFK